VCASGCNFDAVSAAIASAVSGVTTTIDVAEGSYVETAATNVTGAIIFKYGALRRW
jgi:pectin methylesterase-like acyl-CoA thioesterase